MFLRRASSADGTCSRAILASLLILLFTLTLLLAGCGGSSTTTTSSPTPPGTPAPPGGGGNGGGGSASGGGSSSGGGSGSGGGGNGGSTASDQTLKTEDVATGLDNPWSLAFAPDGRLFLTEPPGRLRVIDSAGLVAAPVLDISSQSAGFEAGTTGMDLDPNFVSNGFIYLHYCTSLSDGLHCRIARLIATGNTAHIDTILFDYNAHGQADHTGGRLKVGPDHLLYLSTGDHDDPASAQDLNSMSGKILRMNLDGSPAAGNPFAGAPFVYALGFRDPQGLAWDSSGQLYGTDNGPTSNDEVNIIFAGKNYGWPNCVGACNNPLYVDPIKLFSPQTAPPSGAMFYHGNTIAGWDGAMLFAVLGLADNTFAHHVHWLKLDKPGGTKIVNEQILWQNKFGRIRDVAEGPDGFLYFSTSNQHTSVAGNPGDDRIIRAHP